LISVSNEVQAALTWIETISAWQALQPSLISIEPSAISALKAAVGPNLYRVFSGSRSLTGADLISL
jgi:hypothetical protein